MYREAEPRPRTPPTRIVYASKDFRPGALAGAVCFVAGALLFLAFVSLTHVTCVRGDADLVRGGRCTVATYGVITTSRASVDLSELKEMKYELARGSKGGSYAIVWFERNVGERLPLSGKNLITAVDPEVARDATSAFQRYRDSSAEELDVWLRPSTFALVCAALFPLLFLFVAAKMVWQQLEQFREIVLVVDHDGRRVIVGGKTIAIADIEEIVVASGPALGWAAKKGESIVGHKVRVLARDGTHADATRAFRAGLVQIHQKARRDLAKAIGLRLRD